MINWRRIDKVGLPDNPHIKYLVTDGKDISTSDISGITTFRENQSPAFKFEQWAGDDNTWEDNHCCSGEPMFDMTPIAWCPIDELNLPI